MMQRDVHQTWTLKIRSKANNFHFHFNRNSSKTVRKFFEFSIELKLRPFLFKIKSEPGSSFSWKRRSFKTRSLQFFQNLRIPIAKNKCIVARRRSRITTLKWCARKGSVCESSLILVGSLAHLYLSISKTGEDPIFILGSFICLYFAFLLKNYWRRKKSCNSLGVVVFAILGCWAISHLSNHFYGSSYYISRFIWRAWNYAASLCFYDLFPR